METGGTLLCAIDTDESAPTLVATARAWAAATRCRPIFVHGCGTRSSAKAPAALAALGVDDGERLLACGDPATVITAAVARLRPALLLIASARNAGGRPGRVAGAVLRAVDASVAVVPRYGGEALAGKPVVCAMSLGDHDEAAVRFAHALAAVAGARLMLRPVLGSRDAVLLAAKRARSSVAAPASQPVDTGDRCAVLTRRMLELARDADAGALVVASRPGDAVSRALESDALWAAAPCPVVVARP